MFILRKLLKLILLPVSLVLFLVKWGVEFALHLTGAVVGFFILYVGACFVYCLFSQRWSDMFMLALVFLAVVAVLFICVLLQETCDSLREKIRML